MDEEEEEINREWRRGWRGRSERGEDKRTMWRREEKGGWWIRVGGRPSNSNFERGKLIVANHKMVRHC
jgi:hypothetical protein